MSRAAPQSISDGLINSCGYWMALGMPYETYWHGDVRMFEVYRDAHDRVAAETNRFLWLQGIYVYDAVAAALDAAFAKKGAVPKSYLKHPIPITQQEQQAETIRKIKHTLDWVAKGQR